MWSPSGSALSAGEKLKKKTHRDGPNVPSQLTYANLGLGRCVDDWPLIHLLLQACSDGKIKLYAHDMANITFSTWGRFSSSEENLQHHLTDC